MSVLTPPLPPGDDIVELQEAIATRLRGDARFAKVLVVVEAVGDIENQIETVVSTLGAYALVMTPSLPVPHPDLSGPVFDALRIVVRCGEIPLVNRSVNGIGISSLCLAVAAMERLHQWTPPGHGSCLTASTDGVQSFPDVPQGELAYDAHLRLGSLN